MLLLIMLEASPLMPPFGIRQNFKIKTLLIEGDNGHMNNRYEIENVAIIMLLLKKKICMDGC
jgi:hypothetical protein